MRFQDGFEDPPGEGVFLQTLEVLSVLGSGRDGVGPLPGLAFTSQKLKSGVEVLCIFKGIAAAGLGHLE